MSCAMEVLTQASSWQPGAGTASRVVRGRARHRSITFRTQQRRRLAVPCTAVPQPDLGSSDKVDIRGGTEECAAGGTGSNLVPGLCSSEPPSLGRGRVLEIRIGCDSVRSENTATNEHHEKIESSPTTLGRGACSLPAPHGRHARRTDLPAKARKVQGWERCLILLGLIFIVSVQWLHAQLEQSSADYVEQVAMFDYMSVEDWHLLYRAGIWSRQSSMQVDRQRSIDADKKPHPLVGQSMQHKGNGCFFLDVLGQTHVVPIQGQSWREAILH